MHNYNFVKGIDPKTGELIGRRDFTAGKQDGRLCPRIAGGVSWNSGSYSPKTGLYYKIGNEWCMTLEVVKTTPVTEPQAQLNIGANFRRSATAERRDLRSPRCSRSDHRRQEMGGPFPRAAAMRACCRRRGNLVFVPDAAALLHAYNAETGSELWNHSRRRSAIRAASSATPPAASSTSPSPRALAACVGDDYAPTFGEPYKSMPRDEGSSSSTA